jgi:fimbrial isopeptide formation D2 family protein/uncharacterized repeat protein (TIGR01451 family)
MKSPLSPRRAFFETLEDRILFDATVDPAMESSSDGENSEQPAHQQETENSDSVADGTGDQTATEHERTELVIIDRAVEDYESLIRDLTGRDESDRTIEVVLLDADSDGIEQLSNLLSEYSDLDAIHLISHGEDGSFRLGDTWVNETTLQSNAGAISAWGEALSETGDILLYGCDVAESSEGRDLVDGLAALTGADVVASEDETGAAHRGGDWQLEYASGSIETEIVTSSDFQQSYQHVFAAGPDVRLPSGAITTPLGEDFNFNLTFRNTGDTVGYGPFVDLLFPTSGADGYDGISFGSASYLGTAVNSTVQTFADSGGGFGSVEHPYLESAVNELQAITMDGSVTGGTFTISFGGQTTVDLAFDADAATIATAVGDLTSVDASEINVTGGMEGGYVLIEFIGAAAQTDQADFSVDGTNLIGTGAVHQFTVNDGSATTVKHRLFGKAGDQLVTLELPFGSYSPGQPEATITISASGDQRADLDEPLFIQARSGFRFGEDPIDNMDDDPMIVDDQGFDVSGRSGASSMWTENVEVQTTLMTVRKDYSGPENETATGENYERTYTIHVDIADGQTISDLDVFDSLPDNIVVTGITSVEANGTGAAYSDNLSSLTFPGTSQELIVSLTNDVTGTTSTSDVSVSFTFYVDEFDGSGDRVIPTTGEDDTTSSPDSRSINNARASGQWQPIDTNDDPATATADPAGPEHVLDNKSIAIQKSVAIVNNVGSSGATPGDTLEYTLQFQISDYFTFGDLLITDVFQDGQLFDFGYGATFDITDMNGNVTGSFTVREVTDADGGQTLVVDQTQINTSDNGSEDGITPDGTDGSTTLTFDLSKVLTDNGAADGILQGGLTDGTTNLGAATGTIRFRTIIQDEYADTFASGDRSVDQGDTITNANLTIVGTVRENAEDDDPVDGFSPLERVVGSESDTSSASVTIQGGTLEKTVYAINGSTSLPTNPDSGKVILVAGDVVTYRINYSLSSADFEDLVISDFLPLPIFDVTDHDADGTDNTGATFGWSVDIGNSFDATPPDSGVIEFGNADSFYNSNPTASNITPSVVVDAGANSLSLDFGSYDDPNSLPANIELYISVTASDLPTADGLFLTNMVRASEGTTQQTPTTIDRIVQVEITQPILGITKGVVATDQDEELFDNGAFGTDVGPVVFADVGSSDSFTGILSSDGLDTIPVDANVSNLEAGDRVRFAIVVENYGSSYRGAQDVQIRDVLPPGMSFVSGSMQVVDGTGAAHTFVDANAGNPGLFGDGIIIDDPGPTPDTSGADAGSIDGYNETSGRNILVIIYDAEVQSTAEINESITNEAEVVHYASKEGGQNHASGLTDTADVELRNFDGTKTIVSTSEAHTGFESDVERVTIGETVRYRIQVEIPQGSLGNFIVRDLLPGGLTFRNNGTATVGLISGGGLTSSTLSGGSLTSTDSNFTPTFVLPDDAIMNAVTDPGDGTEDNYNTGTDVYFHLGDLTNADDDMDAEYVVIEFDAVVDNNSTGSQNDTGESRYNDFRVQSGASVDFDLDSADRPRVQIVEPSINAPTIVSDITSGDAGDTIEYTIDFDVNSGANQSDAFDVVLNTSLPNDFTFGSLASIRIDGSIVNSGDADYPTVSQSGSNLTLTFDRLNEGQSVELIYDGTVDGTITPADTLTTNSTLTWTSLPTDSGSGGATGERDGSDTTGEPNDYYQTTSQDVTVDTTWDITKTLIGTEFTSGGNGANQAVIGEIVTYEIEVAFPEASVPNSLIVDTLDAGLAFVGMVSTSDSGINYTGSLTPTITNSGRTITWDLGNVTDSDTSDGNGGSLTLRYQAVVLNTTGNQASTALDNVATYTWGNDSDNDVTDDAADVTVVEPVITLDQTIEIAGNAGQTTGDAGDSIEYTIEIENTGNVDAFDLDFSDVLPAIDGVSAINGVLLTVADSAGMLTGADFTLSGSDATGYSVAYTGTTGAWDMLDSETGRTITLTLSGTLSSASTPNASLSNDPQVTFTSLDGDLQNRSAHNTASDERDGSNDADTRFDYVAADSITYTINPPTFTKSLFSTDQTETSGTDVTIGEKVTYALLVTLPEGSTPGLTLVDQLPTGLQYDSAQVISTVAGSTDYLGNTLLDADFNGTLPGATITGGGSDGADVTISLGAITVNSDNDATNNSFVVLVTATVTDNVANVGYGVGQTTLGNVANYDVSGDGVAAVNSNQVDVDVVESNLQITKSVDLDHVNARDLITVTLTVNNTGLGDAYDVVLRDILDPAIYDLSTLGLGASGTDYPADFTANNASGTITYSGGTIAAGGSATATFTVRVHDDVVVGQDVTNTANITAASTLSGTEAGERSETDADGDGSDEATDDFHVREHSLDGYVYFDADNDGARDGGETGIDGVTVTLTGTDHLGRTITPRTYITGSGGGDPDGFYLFEDLRPGTYTITQTQPTTATNGKHYLDGTDTLGDGGGNDSVNDTFSSIVLSTANENGGSDYNFAELEEIEISGSVWHDANNDGIRQVGETGIDGVTVTLTGTDDNGAITAQDFVTSGGGFFSFDALRPGEYTLTETQPTFAAPSGRNYADGLDRDGSLSNGDASTTNDQISSINASAGDTATDYRFGEVVESVLSGYVFNDLNNDGDRSDGIGINNITITLTGTDDLGNTVNRSTTTDSGGYYEFANLRPSNATGYTISQPTQPSGFLDGIDTVGLQGGTLGNDQFTAVVIASDTAGTENNFAELRPNTLEGYVFNDRDNDGVREAGEEGIAGVTLTISGTDDRGNSFSTDVVTDSNGKYEFLNLRPSDATGYTITQTQPGDWNDGIHSDGSFGNGDDSTANVISSINLLENASGQDYNFGERGATIAGTVFVDDDRDGTQQAGETTGILGVRIELYDSTGTNLLEFTTTDASGDYQFDHYAAGDYVVRQVHPTLYTSTSPDDINVTLPLAGISDQDFGEALFDIGDTVYFDENGNGSRDAGEQALVGVNVRLIYDGGDSIFGNGNDVITNTTTDNAGNYVFTEQFNGSYQVVITGGLPAGTVGTQETDDSSAAIDGTSNIVVGGSDRFDVDFGYTGQGTIGDFVFFDGDNDGVQDTGEPGLADITVELRYAGADNTFNTADDLVFDTPTNSSGGYFFTRMPAGQFQINVDTADADLPTGLTGVTGTESIAGTQTITLATAGTNDAVDFGFTGTHTVGDTIFYDIDGNGVRNGSEPGMVGVTVQIAIDLDGDSVADYTATQVTDQSGGYSFDNVPDGTHTVTVVTPEGSTPTTNHDGSAGGDNASTFVISGADDNDQDFGFQGTGSIGETVYWDIDRDGTQDGDEVGLYNVPVQLDIDFNGDGTIDHTLTTTTDVDGDYSFDNLVAGTYAVTVTPLAGTIQSDDPDSTLDDESTVVLTAGEDNTDQNFGYYGQSSLGDTVFWDVNANNAFDVGVDRGLEDVDVTLAIDFDGDTNNDFTRTIQTDANGEYLFENLIAGTYTVSVTPASVPGSMSAGPTVDADGVGTAHQSTRVLGTSEDADDQDFGYTGTGRVGELIYWDANNNGAFDAGTEVGLVGVTVTMDVDIDGDGDFDQTFSTTTDANGNYEFTNLPASDYRITVTPQTGTTITDDADTTLDSVTTFSLSSGQDKDDVTFGYRGNSSIGDLVYFDYIGNGGTFNAGENDRGVSGVTVTLEIDVNGDTVVDYTATDTTDSNGLYQFDHLIAGDYQITVASTDLPDQMGDNPTYNVDSTIDNAALVSLAADTDNETTDFGYHAQPDYTITVDDGNENVIAGQAITYTVDLTNNGTHTGLGLTITQTYDNTQLENVVASHGGVVDAGAGTITWTLASLDDNGGNQVFTVNADVVEILPGHNNPLVGAVMVADNAFNGIDPTTANNTDTDTDQVVDLQTVKNVTSVVANGDLWDVSFEILVDNTGSVRLDQLTLLDNLSTQFGGALVSVTRPTLDTSGLSTSVAPTVNTNWESNTSLNMFDPLATDEFLVAGDSFVVSFTATIDPDHSGTSTALFNQATAGGTDVTTTPGTPRTVSDQSDGGTSTTSTNLGAPGDLGTENDPTRIYVTDIAVAKQQTSFTQDPVTRNYTVDYTLFIENIGTTTLDQLTLVDDVAAKFGDAFVEIQAGSLAIQNTSGTGTMPTVNSNWENDTSLSLVDATGASIDAGGSFEITFSVVVDPDGVDGLSDAAENQATAGGRGLDEYGNPIFAGGNPVIASDLSDGGANPNTTNAGTSGDTGSSDDATPLTLPEIAAAKRLVSSEAISSGAGGERELTYEVVIRNVGTLTLDSLTLTENLAGQFGSAFLGVIDAPQIVASTTADEPNIAAWNGNAQPEIFDGVSGSLRPGEDLTVRFSVRVDIDQLGTASSNQVTVSGEHDSRPLVAGNDGTVTDLSDTGSNPSSYNPGNPGDTGGFDDPTLVPAIGIALDHGDATKIADSNHFILPVTLTVENLGATDLNTLRLFENLEQIYGEAFIQAANVQINTAGVTGTPPVLNTAWTDDVSQNMLAGTIGELLPGDTFTITFDLTLDPDAGGTSSFMDNQATIFASDPSNVDAVVQDISDSGASASTTNAGEPGDQGTADDTTPLQIPDLGIAKSIVDAKQLGLTYELTIQLVLENTGTVELSDFELFDDLADQYGVNFGKVIGSPRITQSNATVDPVINALYATDTTQSIFDGVTGVLRPGESITVQVVVEVVSEPGQTEVTLVNHASGTAIALDENGNPLRNQAGVLVGRITDWSDSGVDPNGFNPGQPGDLGTWDDPTPIDLTFFTFDAYNDFSQNGKGLLQDGKRDASQPFAQSGTATHSTSRILSQNIQSLAPDPIFSGSARPGTQIVGRIFDSAGRMIGEELSMADVGGNWMMQFHQVESNDHVRIEFVEMPGTENHFGARGDSYGYLGLDNVDNDYASLEPWTSYKDSHDFTAQLRPSVQQSLMRSHRLQTRPLGLGR